MIIKIIYIATGGALGSILRFFISNFTKIYFPYFPAGTLLINISGSFFIGFCVGYLNNKDIPDIIIKYFFIIGLLGSFTTFSAFSFENLELIKQSKMFLSLIYITFSVVFGILAAYIGFTLIKY